MLLASPSRPSCVRDRPQELSHWLWSQNLPFKLSSGIAYRSLSDCQMTGRGSNFDSNLNYAAWPTSCKDFICSEFESKIDRNPRTNCVDFESFWVRWKCRDWGQDSSELIPTIHTHTHGLVVKTSSSDSGNMAAGCWNCLQPLSYVALLLGTEPMSALTRGLLHAVLSADRVFTVDINIQHQYPTSTAWSRAWGPDLATCAGLAHGRDYSYHIMQKWQKRLDCWKYLKTVPHTEVFQPLPGPPRLSQGTIKIRELTQQSACIDHVEYN